MWVFSIQNGEQKQCVDDFTPGNNDSSMKQSLVPECERSGMHLREKWNLTGAFSFYYYYFSACMWQRICMCFSQHSQHRGAAPWWCCCHVIEINGPITCQDPAPSGGPAAWIRLPPPTMRHALHYNPIGERWGGSAADHLKTQGLKLALWTYTKSKQSEHFCNDTIKIQLI